MKKSIVFVLFLSIFTLLSVTSISAQSWKELMNKVATYYQQGKYDIAIEYGEKAVLQAEKEFDKKHKNYAMALNNLALCYENLGNYTKAKSLYLEALKITKDVFGENHPSYSTSLNNIAGLYYNLGDYINAEPMLLEALKIRKQSLGENNPKYATSLNNLAELYRVIGSYTKAEPLYLEALNIIKQSLGEDNPSYATSLNNLAVLYQTMGFYTKAETLCLEVVNIRKQVLGVNHSDYAMSLNNLAQLFQAMGNYSKAEPLYLEASKIYKQSLGENHSSYAMSLNNLALLYQTTGNYVRAEQLYIEAIKIYKQSLGETHPTYATSLNNLAGFYQIFGDYTKAEPLYLEALKIIRQSFGMNHASYALSLNNLAELYRAMGNFTNAEPLYLEASKIFKQLLGENDPSYATTLINLAGLYQEIGTYSKAKPLFVEGIKIFKQVYGEKHTSYAMSIHNLAFMYYKIGNYTEAEPLYLEALKITKQIFGENHPSYATSLINLASLYYYVGEYTKAGSFITEASENYLNHILQNFPNLSENEKTKFLKTIDFQFEKLFSFSLKYQTQSPQIVEEMLNLRLATKGVILSSLNRIRESVDNSGDEGLKLLSRNLIEAKKILYNNSLLSIDEQKKRGIGLSKLEKESNDLEKELSRKSDGFRKLSEEKNIKYSQIENNLSTDEGAVEFVEFQYYDKHLTDTIYYTALITRLGYKTPVLVKLCTQKELGEILNFTPSENTRSPKPLDEDKGSLAERYKSLYKLIWEPIEQYLKGCKTVYLSPSGTLNKVSFAALSKDGINLLIDNVNIKYVGNLRDIVIEKNENKQLPIINAVLFGGAIFDADHDLITKFQNSNNVQSELKCSYNPFSFQGIKSQLINTGDSASRGGITWNYLPGTMKEVLDISDVISKKNINVVLDTGLLANENNLKLLSGKIGIGILHISTHGFFFAEKEKDYSKNTLAKNSDQKQNYSVLDNPLYRSGIVLSGANNSVKAGNDITDESEDGIITAYEISLLDLSNVEIVILSACETGLGDIKGGEGVYGLQRAFKVAGAKNVIMSLWKVPDKETAELMKYFYENWLNKGMDKREALLEAQKQMRLINPNPYYWAAFVMV